MKNGRLLLIGLCAMLSRILAVQGKEGPTSPAGVSDGGRDLYQWCNWSMLVSDWLIPKDPVLLLVTPRAMLKAALGDSRLGLQE